MHKSIFHYILIIFILINSGCSHQDNKNNQNYSEALVMLSEKLQIDPQKFGYDVLMLQQQIANNQNQTNLKKKLDDYLLVIKLLESPVKN